jgi:hypothetical protein
MGNFDDPNTLGQGAIVVIDPKVIFSIFLLVENFEYLIVV